MSLQMQSISYSYLHTFACPYAAFLRYQGGMRGKTTKYLALGNALHLALEEGHNLVSWDLPKVVKIFKDEFMRIIWDDEVGVGWPEIKKMEGEGLKMLEKFDQQRGVDFPANPTEVEAEFRLPFNNLEIIGKIDRIDRDGDEYDVTDYKSGSKEPEQWFLSRNLQFTVYAWAGLEKYGKLPRNMYWHHLRNGKRLVTTRTLDDIEELKRTVSSVIGMNDNGIRYRIYHEYICGFCEYKGAVCDSRTLEEDILNGYNAKEPKY
jgi:hypothetical protein